MELFSGCLLLPVPKNIKRRFRRSIRVASKGVCTDVAAIDEQMRECKLWRAAALFSTLHRPRLSSTRQIRSIVRRTSGR